MTYEKPEVTVLGAATELIRGNKSGTGESGDPSLHSQGACELDD